jgi:hypothetical protein
MTHNIHKLLAAQRLRWRIERWPVVAVVELGVLRLQRGDLVLRSPAKGQRAQVAEARERLLVQPAVALTAARGDVQPHIAVTLAAEGAGQR